MDHLCGKMFKYSSNYSLLSGCKETKLQALQNNTWIGQICINSCISMQIPGGTEDIGFPSIPPPFQPLGVSTCLDSPRRNRSGKVSLPWLFESHSLPGCVVSPTSSTNQYVMFSFRIQTLVCGVMDTFGVWLCQYWHTRWGFHMQPERKMLPEFTKTSPRHQIHIRLFSHDNNWEDAGRRDSWVGVRDKRGRW